MTVAQCQAKADGLTDATEWRPAELRPRTSTTRTSRASPGQNLQDRYVELRAEADFQVNQKAEREIETVLDHLTSQNEIMLEIPRRSERLDQGQAAASYGPAA